MDTKSAGYRIHTITSDKPNAYPFTIRVERDGVLVGCEGGRHWEEYGDVLSLAVSNARSGMDWRKAKRARQIRENQERWATANAKEGM
jgi:hypothetical protein